MRIRSFFVVIVMFFVISFMFISCGGDDEDGNSNYKKAMRIFVQDISSYAKSINSNFIIIPQNGHELVSDNGDTDGNPEMDYINAIDALGQEDLFYGYDDDNEATPAGENAYLTALLDKAKNSGKVILVTDYCWTASKMDDSYRRNVAKGYISYAAESRELEVISEYPAQPNNVNINVITNISQVKNFLYLINPDDFSSKADYIAAVQATNFDLLIMDCFFDTDVSFTASEVNQLKQKANGGSRLVVSYMSIGEAEDYRYYWKDSWRSDPPDWLAEENNEWPGNYKVKYWNSQWQDIIYGNNNSYLKKVLDAGFDGVYLDIIEAFEYFE